MGAPVSNAPLQCVGNFLSRHITDEGWFGRNFGAGKTADAFILNKTTGKFNAEGDLFARVANWLPKFMRQGISNYTQFLSKTFPALAKASSAIKGNLVIDSVINTGVGLYDTYKGFNESEGSFLEKLGNGLWSGVKSLGKGFLVTAACATAALGIPALMGIAAASAPGIAVGILSWMFVGMVGGRIMDGLIDPHSHLKKKQGNEYDNLAVPQGSEDIVKNIQHQYDKRFDNPYYERTNPFIRPA